MADFFVGVNGMDVGGVWGEGKKEGCCGGWFLERGRDGVLVVLLDGRVWSRDDLVAATATAGRNSKNYHSYVFLLSECMISPI